MMNIISVFLDKVISKFKDKFISDEKYFFFKRNNIVGNDPYYKPLYYACNSSNIEFLYYNEINSILHFKTHNGLHVSTNKYYWIFIEILCDKKYTFIKNLSTKITLYLMLGRIGVTQLCSLLLKSNVKEYLHLSQF